MKTDETSHFMSDDHSQKRQLFVHHCTGYYVNIREVIWNAPKSMRKIYFSRDFICIKFWNAQKSNTCSIFATFEKPNFRIRINRKLGISKFWHVMRFRTKEREKLKVFDFWAFQNFMHMKSREKYILHMLFEAVQITSRITWWPWFRHLDVPDPNPTQFNFSKIRSNSFGNVW